MEIVAEPNGPGDNISVIVEKACRYNPEHFDWVIEQFLKCEDKADRWMDAFRAEELQKANEHAIDAAYADHIYDQPQDQYYSSSTGLKTAIEVRYELEEFLGSPHINIAIDSLAILRRS